MASGQAIEIWVLEHRADIIMCSLEMRMVHTVEHDGTLHGADLKDIVGNVHIITSMVVLVQCKHCSCIPVRNPGLLSRHEVLGA